MYRNCWADELRRNYLQKVRQLNFVCRKLQELWSRYSLVELATGISPSRTTSLHYCELCNRFTWAITFNNRNKWHKLISISWFWLNSKHRLRNTLVINTIHEIAFSIFYLSRIFSKNVWSSMYFNYNSHLWAISCYSTF